VAVVAVVLAQSAVRVLAAAVMAAQDQHHLLLDLL
jgi:hypothetical protein